jgi:hypothetical protein
MNTKAEGHLARAEGYFAKGDAWYAKAADEIIAARAADPTLGNREIGKWFGRSDKWVGLLVQWRTSAKPDSQAPIDWKRGSHATASEIQAGAEKLLKTAPLETVEHIVESLPPKQAAKLAQAAMAKPGVEREIAKSAEASATAVRFSGAVMDDVAYQERQKAKRRSPLGRSGLDVIALMTAPLNKARRLINDSYEAARDGDLTDEHRDLIREDLDEIVQLIDWYRSFLASGDQSFEDELEKLLGN